MKSWKTTLAGILSAAGAALVNSDDKIVHTIGVVLVIIGPIIMGASAKDSNVTNVGADAKTLKEIKQEKAAAE